MYHNILVPISFDAERDTSAPLKLAKILATPDANVTLLPDRDCHNVETMVAYRLRLCRQGHLTLRIGAVSRLRGRGHGRCEPNLDVVRAPVLAQAGPCGQTVHAELLRCQRWPDGRSQ